MTPDPGLFQAPLPLTQLECQGLRGMLDGMRLRCPGSGLGTQQGGWASLKLLQDSRSPTIRHVMDSLHGLLRAHWYEELHIYQLWGVITDPGGEIGEHDHHQATLGGIVYLHTHPIPTLVKMGQIWLKVPATGSYCVIFGGCAPQRWEPPCDRTR